MRFHGYHGVLPFEKEDGQPFEVDVELYLSLERASAADDLRDTVDYREVYECVRSFVTGQRYDLLESLAGSIADALRVRFRVNLVVVRVRKPQAPLGGPLDYAEVQVIREGVSA
jgi:dihydroneopterin aldolase